MVADTSLGGGNRQFPQTTWGLVARLRETTQHRAALEDLCRRYWKPVYSWIRAAWSKPAEDAKDLTQAFFLLFRIREEVRREIRADLRQMTSDEGELDEEWNALFRS